MFTGLLKEEYFKSTGQDCIVAFIDILGFRDIVMGDDNDANKAIDIIDDKIKTALEIVKEDSVGYTSVRLFSDCMCVACDFDFHNTYNILYEIAYLQLYLATEEIFTRGGLSFGKHFQNDRIIFSKALIQAYDLEKRAIYPRVVLDKCFIDYVMGLEDETDKNRRIFLIEQSPDKLFFIDYLEIVFDIDFDNQDLLKKHKNAIINQARKHHMEPQIVDKYRWLAEYHNLKISEYVETQKYDKNRRLNILEELLINIKSVFPAFQKPWPI
jgi:hypothetical protein